MVEQDLELVENNGYKNLYLKPNKNKGIKGLEDGNFVIVEKLYDEGREMDGKWGKVYSCGVRYKDESTTFLLNPKDYAMYLECGVLGDKVRITLNKITVENRKTGVEMIIPRLSFEKV